MSYFPSYVSHIGGDENHNGQYSGPTCKECGSPSAVFRAGPNAKYAGRDYFKCPGGHFVSFCDELSDGGRGRGRGRGKSQMYGKPVQPPIQPPIQYGGGSFQQFKTQPIMSHSPPPHAESFGSGRYGGEPTSVYNATGGVQGRDAYLHPQAEFRGGVQSLPPMQVPMATSTYLPADTESGQQGSKVSTDEEKKAKVTDNFTDRIYEVLAENQRVLMKELETVRAEVKILGRANETLMGYVKNIDLHVGLLVSQEFPTKLDSARSYIESAIHTAQAEVKDSRRDFANFSLACKARHDELKALLELNVEQEEEVIEDEEEGKEEEDLITDTQPKKRLRKVIFKF